IIEVVEDEEEVEETVIESTETEQDTEIVEVEDVVVEEVEEDLEVPFSVIENVPVFPGCEREKNNNAKRQCMSDKIAQFVNKKFNTDLAGDLGLSGRQRISVFFKIDKNGNITNVGARAPHPGLEKEAKRVIGLLPKMQPGKQRGKPVTVPYSLPILFQVQD
ncbi:MAG: energy transducer TonB, partial [Flavobacteriaceae bacterium]